MKSLCLFLHLTDDLGLKAVTIDFNDTDLPNDSKLLKKAAIVILKSLKLNEDKLAVDDLLNELGIIVE